MTDPQALCTCGDRFELHAPHCMACKSVGCNRAHPNEVPCEEFQPAGDFASETERKQFIDGLVYSLRGLA